MLKQVMGTYIPTRFSISLNLKPQNFNIKDATFVHEYIHFLQDLLLPYCIRHNLVFINEFACLSGEAEHSGKIIRPFTKWNEDCKKNLTSYRTPYGVMMLGVDTRKVVVEEKPDELTLKIDYILEANYQFVADCQISVRAVSVGGGQEEVHE